MSQGLSIRDFLVREADWETEGKLLSNIRRLVFIQEQKVPVEEEWDGRDDTSYHWIATDPEDVAIGTARLLPDGQIGRMAVLPPHRGTGVGAALLEAAVEKARHLGFNEVYLNAQTHALGFYESVGFKPTGDEFDEAGIPHRRMTQSLAPVQKSGQRILPSSTSDGIEMKSFDTREVSFDEWHKLIHKVREIVFVHELKQARSSVTDDADDEAIHWIAEDIERQVIGAVRMSVRGEISQLAVLSQFRRQGVGTSLLELAVNKAIRFGLDSVNLRAPAALRDLFEKAGFQVAEDTEAETLTFSKEIVLEDVHEPLQRPMNTDGFYSDSEVTYKVGEDKKLILLRRETDFRNIILEMCAQARASIRIYSPVLEHKLFDNNELMEMISALARRNRYTRIEMLIYDSHRVIKNGHALLNIARKLPTSIGMKIVHPELRQLNHEYVLVDDAGVIYRLDDEDFDGWANFNDVSEVNRYGRQFQRAWDSGLYDPYLRQIKI